jgi:hypothetical protein
MTRARLWLVLGVAVLVWLGVRPAEAGCYECTERISCIGIGTCWYWWECTDQGVGCSGCTDGCMEGFDTCRQMGTYCQWARIAPIASDKRTSAFLASLLAEAPAQVIRSR